MITSDNRRGHAVLMLAHVAGMIDMVALPLWVGALMQHYQYRPAQAGVTVTLFLVGVVIASAFFAPRFNSVPRNVFAAGGFAWAAVVFAAISLNATNPDSFGVVAALHCAAGLGVGCALSLVHGTIGRSANPHRLFASVNIALGMFAVIFLAGVPQILPAFGGAALFRIIAGLMAVAAIATGLFFPTIPTRTDEEMANAKTPLPPAVWLIIGTIICLTLNQSMVFSFLERIGTVRGFGTDRVNGVLIALGFVNLLPGVFAALLQRRLNPVVVGMMGPVAQALLALTMSNATSFAPYAIAASLYVSAVIFTHTFLFGMLTRLDVSGRAAAATPAMMTIGACAGPALGGIVVQTVGYWGLGLAACVIAAVAVTAMSRVSRNLSARSLLAGHLIEGRHS